MIFKLDEPTRWLLHQSQEIFINITTIVGVVENLNPTATTENIMFSNLRLLQFVQNAKEVRVCGRKAEHYKGLK